MTVVASISRTLLNSMPDRLLFVVIVGIVLIGALGGHMLTRRYLEPLRTAADAGVVAGVTAIVMTLFAFVLAFGVVSLYDQFNSARDSVAGEASSLAQIVRDSRSFPQETQAKIEGAVRAYIIRLRERSFPLMHDGHDDPVASARFANIFAAIQGYEPKTQSQIAFYGSAVAQLNEAVAQGRERRRLINAALPRAFATLIVLTAILSVLTTFFVVTANKALEIVLVSSVAIIVGAGLLTVLLLEYPFSGSVAVSSTPYVEGVLRCVVLRLGC